MPAWRKLRRLGSRTLARGDPGVNSRVDFGREHADDRDRAPSPPPLDEDSDSGPARAGECRGVRMMVGSRGFCLLRADGGRVYATCDQVMEELVTPVERLAPYVDENVRSRVNSISRKLSERMISEGEAARKILMVVGPPVEIAVQSAITHMGDGVGDGSSVRQRVPQPASSTAAATGTSRLDSAVPDPFLVNAMA